MMKFKTTYTFYVIIFEIVQLCEGDTRSTLRFPQLHDDLCQKVDSVYRYYLKDQRDNNNLEEN